jgi:hypothetical protein
MPWYRAINNNLGLKDEFEKIWVANGGPKDAVLFGICDPRHGKFEFYFNPGAAQIAGKLVTRYAQECPRPDIQARGLFLLVGDQMKADGND